MLHTWYYLIEPRPELAARLRERCDADFAEALLEPELFSNDEADRSSWRNADHVLLIKLLYLARIREYTPLASNADASRILDSDRISIDVFDQWWTIRRLTFEGSAHALRDYLRPPISGNIVRTGNALVDSWLKDNCKCK
jgi:hypothetical protein